jgi:dinuclear metal center YbgI/SA1388 family protein
MAALSEIIEALDELLDARGFRDYGPNGLQVEGAPLVSQVVTGVSASVELFEQALARGAELVLVHHGLFWSGEDARVIGPLRTRLGMLLGAGVSLAAYHLPLDAHPVFGNNALIAKGLGAEPTEPFAAVEGRPVGWIARFPGDGIARAELAGRLAVLTGREPVAFLDGPDPIRTVGIVSGGGGRNVHDAIAARLDAFVTGEPEEWARALARESHISYLAGGHHATETFGVRALGELLSERFGLEHAYVEIANPV